MLETAIVEAPVAGSNEDGPIWIEALRGGIYHTPQYGQVPVTKDKLERFVKNFHSNVRGQEIATDFDHGMDRAKGNAASGWYKDLEIRPASDDPTQLSLYAAIDLTDEAKAELAAKKWKYFSLEWNDEWVDTNGVKHDDVIVGGGFTNRPIVKNMMPINFSESLWNELDDDTRKTFAVWSTKQVNDLPDSCFLYIQPGGKKDSEGKTTPRSLRHFPYKNASGSIDLPHLRNAIARIPQAGSWLSAAMKSSLQARARKMLGAHGKAMAEDASDEVKEAYQTLIAEGFEILDESKELEHSEPGTGSPPAPRTDEDGSDDPAITKRWRRDPLPLDPDDPTAPKPNSKSEGGESQLTPEQIAELYKLFNLTPPAPADDTSEVDHSELVGAVKTSFSELANLKAKGMTPEEKKFSEDYPVQFAEMQRLTNERHERAGMAFSEAVRTLKKQEGDNLVDTQLGLSKVAGESVAEFHKKFSEGSATLEDFENTVKAITEGGVVEYGERGSSSPKPETNIDVSSPQGIQIARKMFADKAAEIQAEDGFEGDYNKALSEAAKRYPELAEAYRTPLPA